MRPDQWLHLDVDATITIDHSANKLSAAATCKRIWGHHLLLVSWDRPEIAGGEALAGLLRARNARNNTAADPHHGPQMGAGRSWRRTRSGRACRATDCGAL